MPLFRKAIEMAKSCLSLADTMSFGDILKLAPEGIANEDRAFPMRFYFYDDRADGRLFAATKPAIATIYKEKMDASGNQ